MKYLRYVSAGFTLLGFIFIFILVLSSAEDVDAVDIYAQRTFICFFLAYVFLFTSEILNKKND